MKRQLLLCALCLMLVLPLLAALPASAADDYSFATLNYVCDPATEGGEQVSGVLKKEETFATGVTLTCREDAEMLLDGKAVEGKTLSLSEAGRYAVTVKKVGDSATFEYTVTVLPRVNVYDGQVFTSYPTIECENAEKMTLNRHRPGYVADFASGTTIEAMGEHVLEISGNGCVFEMTFYVKACAATKVYDEASGKNVLRIDVADFEGVSVILDGNQQLAAGTHLISAVGQHSVVATQGDASITNRHALPTQQELFLQVTLLLPETDSREPIWLPLDLWDADFYLDGKQVKGDVRIEHNGAHVLEVRDAEGNVMENAFCILVSAEDAGHTETTLTLTFRNPHLAYALLYIIPATLLIALAACFLVWRRRIV